MSFLLNAGREAAEEPLTIRIYLGDAVGKPVARLPPHRSLREVFPHKAPRLGSLP